MDGASLRHKDKPTGTGVALPGDWKSSCAKEGTVGRSGTDAGRALAARSEICLR